MKNFLDSDGIFYSVCNGIYHVFMLNLIWLLFSIPIFTMGASTTALFKVMDNFLQKKSTNLFKDFFHSFKLNFKQSTFFWILFCGSSMIFYGAMKLMLSSNSTWGKFISPLVLVLYLEVILIFIYIFPVIAKYYLSSKDIVKVSFFLGNRYILLNLIIIAVILLIYYLMYLLPYYSILFFMGFYSITVLYLINPILNKYFKQS